jgi:hypothetical protein
LPKPGLDGLDFGRDFAFDLVFAMELVPVCRTGIINGAWHAVNDSSSHASTRACRARIGTVTLAGT